MDETLPDPLVPPEVDLRGFNFMPLYGEALLNSETWILCNAEEKVAALTLWWKSWHELPAGSLPENERLLAGLAGYGVAVKAFQAVREMAMRQWIKCKDGRYYHRFLASRVATAWLSRCQKDWARECDRIRKENKVRSDGALDPLPLPSKPDIYSIGFPPEVTALSDGNHSTFRRKVGHDPPEIAPNPPETTTPHDGIPPETTTNVRARSELNGTERKKETDAVASVERAFGAPRARPAATGHANGRSANGRAARKSRISADCEAGDEQFAYAAERGYRPEWVESEFPKFRDHHLAKGTLCADWDAAWRTWVQRSPDFARPSSGAGGRTKSGEISAAIRAIQSRGTLD